MPKSLRYIEIMDTTLRDGEQTSGVSFTASEKLTIAQLLLTEVKVDRIEIASARVSEGEFDAVKKITRWAKSKGLLKKIEVLTFVDGNTSIDWMIKAGAKVMNLLTKGSMNHLTHQLKKSPAQHFAEIAAVISKAKKKGIDCNVYLEDWSNGMRNSPEYVFKYLDFLSSQPVKRIMLPDTLGILEPNEVKHFLQLIIPRYPHCHFDFHGHNDYDLGTANVLEAIKAGAHGIHLTINGMGERAGNAPLASAVAVLHDFLPNVKTGVAEKSLFQVSKLVETFSGFRVPVNKPVVGENVFTQTAGIHADGDKKNNLYYNDLLPERFGRQRKYALGKTSGKYIISDVIDSNTIEEKVKIVNYVLTHSKELRPSVTLQIHFNGEMFEEHSQGDGQYDAFMNALRNIYKKKKMHLPVLADYAVRIPPGGKSDALCETIITWENKGKEFKTRGLDSDQTVSAIKATQKMLNMI